MRVSGRERLILDLLAERGPLYGLEMIEASGERLPRGTVYVTLQRMAVKGLVASRLQAPQEGEQGPPRRIFRITPLGTRARAAQAAFDQLLGAST